MGKRSTPMEHDEDRRVSDLLRPFWRHRLGLLLRPLVISPPFGRGSRGTRGDPSNFLSRMFCLNDAFLLSPSSARYIALGSQLSHYNISFISNSSHGSTTDYQRETYILTTPRSKISAGLSLALGGTIPGQLRKFH